MKKPDSKTVCIWLFAIDLAALVFVTFRNSDPHVYSANAATLKDITFDGTYFMLGVLLSPLIYRD